MHHNRNEIALSLFFSIQCTRAGGFQLRRGGVDTALWLAPPPPQRSQLIGPPQTKIEQGGSLGGRFQEPPGGWARGWKRRWSLVWGDLKEGGRGGGRDGGRDGGREGGREGGRDELCGWQPFPNFPSGAVGANGNNGPCQLSPFPAQPPPPPQFLGALLTPCACAVPCEKFLCCSMLRHASTTCGYPAVRFFGKTASR